MKHCDTCKCTNDDTDAWFLHLRYCDCCKTQEDWEESTRLHPYTYWVDNTEFNICERCTTAMEQRRITAGHDG